MKNKSKSLQRISTKTEVELKIRIMSLFITYQNFPKGILPFVMLRDDR
ncbi:hypothetical protein [Algibacter sp. 2305UL17-15]